MTTGIQRAIEAAGDVNKLAKHLKVSHQAVYFWLKRGWVPATRAVQIEKKYGISRYALFSPRISNVVLGRTSQPSDLL